MKNMRWGREGGVSSNLGTFLNVSIPIIHAFILEEV